MFLIPANVIIALFFSAHFYWSQASLVPFPFIPLISSQFTFFSLTSCHRLHISFSFINYQLMSLLSASESYTCASTSCITLTNKDLNVRSIQHIFFILLISDYPPSILPHPFSPPHPYTPTIDEINF